MDEGFPVVCVIHHVPNGSLAMDVGDPPVVTNAIPWATFVFRKRLAGGSDEPTVAWDYDPRIGALPAELVDHIGRSPPVGIDQTALDSHHGTIIPSPFPANQIPGQFLKTSVDVPLESSGLRDSRQRAPCIPKCEIRPFLVRVTAIVDQVSGEVAFPSDHGVKQQRRLDVYEHR